MRRFSRDRSRRGFVLVAVLWTIALLSALAMATSTSSRSFAGLLAIDRDRVQAEALIGAGIEVGADLVMKASGRASPLIQTRFSLSTGDGRVALTDELGKIDINRAPRETLVSLFKGIGAADAEAVAQAIIRWRDPHGASPKKPTNGDAPETARFEQIFTNVDQLTQIPVVTAEYARAISPFVTVFGAETVNAATAPAEVLRLLPQMTEARLERLIATRTSGPLEVDAAERLLGPAFRYAKPTTRRVARLEIAVALADGFAASAEAVIVVAPKDSEPYRILSFRQSARPTTYASRRE
jgi:general secretion pathway protein K